MHRFLLSQLRFRRGRVAALGLGVLVAAVSFTLLTSAVDTSELRVRRTVAKNFRTAYDILVRPNDSFTRLEEQRGLVSNNYLSGIFGGISFRQYRQIRTIPGIEVAVPIANIGYIMLFRHLLVPVNRFLTRDSAQMYRLKFTSLAQNATSRYPDSDQYVYYTRQNPMANPGPRAGPVEVVDGRNIPVCDGFSDSHPNPSRPFALAGATGLTCFSEKSPKVKEQAINPTTDRRPSGWVGAYSQAYFPILLGAIDPVQEERLVGLEQTLVSGRLLRPQEETRLGKAGENFFWRIVPVLASTRTYVDEVIHVDVERLAVPKPSVLRRRLASKAGAYDFVTSLGGKVVGSRRVGIHEVYEALLQDLTAPKFNIPYDGYWTTSAIRHRILGNDRLAPQTVENPRSVFEGFGGGSLPQQNLDVQFRRLTRFPASPESLNEGREYAPPALQVVGRFDPERLPGFSELAAVPLETYYPPSLEPANRASREALAGESLLPTQNVGDYIRQPPLMLTTLEGLRVLTDPQRFTDAEPEAPISVVRVRVANVTGPDPESRERIRQVAQAIHDRTGLAIDITAGSSPHPLRVELPAGKFGRPVLVVQEGWVAKGVAVAFLEAIDRKSLALFGLILLISTFFLANGVLAVVRTRRTEIGTLLCLGWSRSKIFAAILGEVTLVGAIAGLLGAGLAATLVVALPIEMSLARAFLVVPVALGLALMSALFPAWRASASTPLDAVRPAPSETRRGTRIRHIVTMAVANLRRLPARTALGAAGLFIGVGALTMLVAINHAFQGVLLGTVMGQVISLQVRGIDLLTVALTIALGGIAVADVLYLNIKERAAEFVTLRTVGWRDREIVRLLTAEAILMGAIGSVAGALFGSAAAVLIGSVPLTSIAAATSVAATSGILAAALASLFPLSQIRRLTAPSVLAEEW